MSLPASVRVGNAHALMSQPVSGTLDLGAITDCDSSLVACALAWQRAARAQGKTLTFTNPPQAFTRLAQLYGVHHLL
jgi:phospholipid transport system transporter-binding protein